VKRRREIKRERDKERESDWLSKKIKIGVACGIEPTLG
jgi:hypothetical protein